MASRAVRTSRQSTARMALTTSCVARMCWSMSATIARRCANCCASTAPDGFVYLAVPDPFREDVTRDWGFPKPEKYGHWRVYGGDVAERFERYVPEQPVLAYRGEDP